MQVVLELLKYMSVVGICLLLIIFFGILNGCGIHPTGPTPPVIVADSFEEHVAMMKTPAHTAKWMEQFATYSDPYTGWIWPEDKDLTWSLAHDLWKNYIKGFSRGKCGSFAAMAAYCARNSGYSNGIIVWYKWDNEGNVFGHAMAWIKEAEGYSIQDNLHYSKELYMDYTDMLEDLKRQHVNTHSYLIMYDTYWDETTSTIYEYLEED